MTVMRTLRKLVLGETWVVPVGVAALVGAALVVRDAAPALFEDAGGFVLLAGVLGVLLLAVSRGP